MACHITIVSLTKPELPPQHLLLSPAAAEGRGAALGDAGGDGGGARVDGDEAALALETGT